MTTNHDHTTEDQAAALKQAALRMAIEHHARAAQHPNSKAPANPVTVTATAREFAEFLREAVDRAGIDPDTQNPRPGNKP